MDRQAVTAYLTKGMQRKVEEYKEKEGCSTSGAISSILDAHFKDVPAVDLGELRVDVDANNANIKSCVVVLGTIVRILKDVTGANVPDTDDISEILQCLVEHSRRTKENNSG